MKTIRFLLVLVILFSNCYILIGCNNNDNKLYTTQNRVDAVIELSIFTSNGKKESKNILRNYGHSFLSFKNISQNSLKVGEYTLEKDETISLGTWSVSSHFGVWYNLESNYINTYDKYNDRVSVTTQINLEELKLVNDFILNHDYWNPYCNCSYFSINLWNTIAKDTEYIDTSLFYNPSYLYKKLISFSSYETNKAINGKDTFGYYSDTFLIHSFKENF
ncbi:MAG: hypothetical protein IJW82_02140 [Clostridia bacterium]|nr:hypothetical protein [Clostridia bacterium]